jgi:hypothetical protein
VTHRRAADGDAEPTSVNPSFAAFGRAFEAADPFTFRAQNVMARGLASLARSRAYDGAAVDATLGDRAGTAAVARR